MNFGAMKVVMSNQLLCVPLQRHFVVFAVNKAHQKLSSDFFFSSLLKEPMILQNIVVFACNNQTTLFICLHPGYVFFFNNGQSDKSVRA